MREKGKKGKLTLESQDSDVWLKYPNPLVPVRMEDIRLPIQRLKD